MALNVRQNTSGSNSLAVQVDQLVALGVHEMAAMRADDFRKLASALPATLEPEGAVLAVNPASSM